MRSSHTLALALGVTGLGTACGGDGNGPSNAPPTAAFSPSCALLVCTFADGSRDADGQVTAYTWDFGDGTPAATTKDAKHTYAAANTYTVSLTVTDNDGAANGATKSVQVSAQANAPPTADFTSSCTDLACSFTDLSADGDGTVAGFHWDFGDGAEAATQSSTHAYASAGTYVVELTVTDDRGATGHRSQQVTVTGSQTGGPTADFTGSCVVVGAFGRILFFNCTFTDRSTAAAGATLTAWVWDFGNGATATEQNPPVHHYTKVRTSVKPVSSVAVRLTVTDNNGLTNSVTKSVQVSARANAPPTADFTSSCTDLVCTFTDRSGDGDGTLVGFRWDFGDGTEAETQNSTHAYASAGTYVVELTVTDNGGATGSFSHKVTVTGPQARGQATIGLSPTGLSFIYYVRRLQPPPSQTLKITNLGGGTLTWTATSSRSWLKIGGSCRPADRDQWLPTAQPRGIHHGFGSGSVQHAAEGPGESDPPVFLGESRGSLPLRCSRRGSAPESVAAAPARWSSGPKDEAPESDPGRFVVSLAGDAYTSSSTTAAASTGAGTGSSTRGGGAS